MGLHEFRGWRDRLREAHREGVRQAKGFLAIVEDETVGVGYCCLGIRCEQGVNAGRLVRNENNDDMDGRRYFTYFEVEETPQNGMAGHLPEVEARLLASGLDADEIGDPYDPWIINEPDLHDRDGNRLMVSAASANDDLHLSFDQIADCITYTYGLDR